MVWSAPRTYVASEVVTNRILVVDVRDNSFELAPNKIGTKGDLIVGSAANSIGTVGVGSNNQLVLADSAQALGIKWALNPIDDKFVAKGDLFVGSTADVGTILPIGGDGLLLVAKASNPIGVEWNSHPGIISNIVLAEMWLGRL